jgi:hypothetical protein
MCVCGSLYLLDCQLNLMFEHVLKSENKEKHYSKLILFSFNTWHIAPTTRWMRASTAL